MERNALRSICYTLSNELDSVLPDAWFDEDKRMKFSMTLSGMDGGVTPSRAWSCGDRAAFLYLLAGLLSDVSASLQLAGLGGRVREHCRMCRAGILY